MHPSPANKEIIKTIFTCQAMSLTTNRWFNHLILIFFLLSISPFLGFSQNSKLMMKSKHVEVAEQLEINPKEIFRVYELSDVSGDYQIALLEKIFSIKSKDTTNNSIEALAFRADHGGNLVHWSIKDERSRKDQETNIWFWTKYCSFKDLDGDKRIDPVIVYGSKDENGYKRIKIITIYKNRKYVIRANESDLDSGRSFKQDKEIDTLPVPVRKHLQSLLQSIRKGQGVLLKNG